MRDEKETKPASLPESDPSKENQNPYWPDDGLKKPGEKITPEKPDEKTVIPLIR